MFVSIVGAGLPVASSYGAMGLEFSVGAARGRRLALLARAAPLPARAGRADRRLPGPARGRAHSPAVRPDGRELPATGGEPLWDL